ncbi:MAG: ABC transporter permease [Chloroflexota bacterium]|jgi:molybdate transport system permease protein|nr:ABC transporter permease [Chloroflexota bacterium]
MGRRDRPVAEDKRHKRAARSGVEIGPAVWLGAALLVLFLALPLVALVWRAATEASGPASGAGEVLNQALLLSLATSVLSLAIILALGTPLAYLLARRRFRGARLVETLVDLPIVLPPAVAGLALLMAFGRRGLFGRWLDDAGIALVFTTSAVVLAQLFVATPFYVRAARGGFARIDSDLEDAAASLGASPFQLFWRVTLPLARPILGAGAVLAWARALGEFGATILFAGNVPGVTQTMPLAIYGQYNAGDLRGALLLSLVLLLVALLTLLAVRLLGGRAADLTT